MKIKDKKQFQKPVFSVVQTRFQGKEEMHKPLYSNQIFFSQNTAIPTSGS